MLLTRSACSDPTLFSPVHTGGLAGSFIALRARRQIAYHVAEDRL